MMAVFGAAAATASSICPLVTDSEMALARAWATAKFEGAIVDAPPAAGLYVIANHDPVQKNGRAGRPMNIAGVRYERGLYCHAVSRIMVRLPGAGREFIAVCGVDTNDQTAGGRGSVVFGVEVGSLPLVRTPVMREGMPGVPVQVPLNGAVEFVLDIGNADDGITCDQADWANARVVLADGTVLYLGDLPLHDAGPPRTPDTTPPFSFHYGGRPSSEFLSQWPAVRTSTTLNDGRIAHTIRYSEPDGPLRIRCEAVVYADFPTVEWTLFLSNVGSVDTPVLSRILPLDTVFGNRTATLHHYTGSPCTPTDYMPQQTQIGPDTRYTVATSGGRPTNSNLPYFNLEWPDGGVIAVLGWPGQWAAGFDGAPGGGVRASGGQERPHFVLRPGEEVRTPRVVLQFWQTDRARSQNVWRRWMLAHNTPTPAGRRPQPQLNACSSHQFGEMIHADSASQKLFVDRYLAEGIQLDYWWMDAGWYVNNGSWPNTGTWEVDTKRFPGGLRPITDHGHAKGVRSIVWFEPERVNPGTWLYTERPQWLLGQEGGDKLLNLGDPEARRWWIDHADRLIREQGIDLYRTDFNIDPLPFWQAADAPDRQGITEIRYVTGFLEYLDELRRRHPNMLIDTCASGGRRNDIDTLLRSVPLLRSDYILEPEAQQMHTMGISHWIPFYGAGVHGVDPYTFWSQVCPSITCCWDVRRKDLDYAGLRRFVGQWRALAPLMLADYYPLLPYSTRSDPWVAWQFQSPEEGRGVVFAFRRAQSPYESVRLKLQGLDPTAVYRIRRLDGPDTTEATGRLLTEEGLLLAVDRAPGVGVVALERKEDAR